MHASALRARSLTLVLGFGLALACSTTGGSPDPRPAEPEAGEHTDPPWPKVGDPAPPLSLDTLTGSHVALPQSNADRAAVLIFGSFS